jgi:hypothetical protein
MDAKELQTLQENRRKGETLEQTKARLQAEQVETAKPVFPEPEPGIMPPPTNLPTAPSSNSNVPARRDELVQYNPEVHRGVDTDEEGFSDEDLSIARIKIVQPNARDDDAIPGNFKNVLTGEHVTALNGVSFLRRLNGRVLFPENDFSGNRICWSLDGHLPDTHGIHRITEQAPQSAACTSSTPGIKRKIIHCPYAMWGADRTAPPCKETITLLGVDAEMMPFWVIFHGTALSPVKNFLRAVYLKKRKEKKNMRDFQVTISLTKEKNDQGMFFVPVFSAITPTPEDRHEALNELFKVFREEKAPNIEQVEPEAPEPSGYDPTGFYPDEYE